MHKCILLSGQCLFLFPSRRLDGHLSEAMKFTIPVYTNPSLTVARVSVVYSESRHVLLHNGKDLLVCTTSCMWLGWLLPMPPAIGGFIFPTA